MEESSRILQASAGHTVTVVGGNLISNKMFNIMAMVLTSPDFFGPFSINKVIISGNEPEGKFGHHYVGKGEITINLQKHFDSACKSIQKEDDVNAKYLSFRANLWYDLLFTLIHEGGHVLIWEDDTEGTKRRKLTEEGRKEIEEDCNRLAKETIMDLFRDYDCEPATIAEEPYFAARFMQFFIQNIQGGESDWAVRQSIMIDSDFVHYDENANMGVKTMKEWIRMCTEGEVYNHENWEKKGQSIPNAAVNPAVMVAGAAETPVETKELQTKQEAPLPMVQEETQVATQPEVATQPVEIPQTPTTNPFAQASDDVVMKEILASEGHVGSVDIGEGGEESMEGYVQAELQSAPVVKQKVEHKVEEPVITKCSNCQNDLPAKAQFCMFCGAKVDQTTVCVFDKENVNLNAFPGPGSQAVASTATQFVGGPTTPAQTGGAGGAQQSFPRQILRTNLPNHNMNLMQMRGILAEVFNRIHNHVFTKCGFQVCGAGTGASQGYNPNFVGNVQEPIAIGDIPGADKLIIGCDKKNSQTGRIMKNSAITDGTISGWVTKNAQIPAYAIYINNNGMECRRQWMVQNPIQNTAGR